MKHPNRTISDLLDRGTAFNQSRLLTESQFISLWAQRAPRPMPNALDALDRLGLLRPVYVFDPNHPDPIGIDPTSRPLPISQWAAHRLSGISRAREPVTLYSPYQVLLAPNLSTLAQRLGRFDSVSENELASLAPVGIWADHAMQDAAENDNITIALSVLEAMYLPRIVKKLSLRDMTVEEWLSFEENFDPAEALEWLGCDVDWIMDTANRLLAIADGIDPLRDWRTLVREIRPKKWELLRDNALIAMDYLIAAEMLLLLHDHLIIADAIPPLDDVSHHLRNLSRRRLGTPDTNLDSVLTDFEISPHPSLVLVIEGETESILVPKALSLLEIPNQRNLIDIFNARGIDKDFGFLASYLTLPEVGETDTDFAMLIRPATSFLVVIDPEGRYKTEKNREARREAWIKEICQRLPQDRRSEAVRKQVEMLVHIDSWGAESFEFAHFSDHELATGIALFYSGNDPLPTSEIAKRVSNVRRSKGRLDKEWKHWQGYRLSKPDLAKELWPILEAKIVSAIERGDQETIPIVRVLEKALQIATEHPRSDLGLFVE